MFTSETKSKVLRRLVHICPDILSKEAVRRLTTDPDHTVFGLEDGAEAATDASFNDGAVGDVSQQVKDLNLDIYPSVRLQAELVAAKDVNRELYDDFTETWDQLDKIISKIDKEFGSDFDHFLQDEIITQPNGANDAIIEKIINAGSGVDLVTINSENNPLAKG